MHVNMYLSTFATLAPKKAYVDSVYLMLARMHVFAAACMRVYRCMCMPVSVDASESL